MEADLGVGRPIIGVASVVLRLFCDKLIIMMLWLTYFVFNLAFLRLICRRCKSTGVSLQYFSLLGLRTAQLAWPSICGTQRLELASPVGNSDICAATECVAQVVRQAEAARERLAAFDPRRMQ